MFSERSVWSRWIVSRHYTMIMAGVIPGCCISEGFGYTGFLYGGTHVDRHKLQYPILRQHAQYHFFPCLIVCIDEW
jgi:hypothetical protein